MSADTQYRLTATTYTSSCTWSKLDLPTRKRTTKPSSANKDKPQHLMKNFCSAKDIHQLSNQDTGSAKSHLLDDLDDIFIF